MAWQVVFEKVPGKRVLNQMLAPTRLEVAARRRNVWNRMRRAYAFRPDNALRTPP